MLVERAAGGVGDRQVARQIERDRADRIRRRLKRGLCAFDRSRAGPTVFEPPSFPRLTLARHNQVGILAKRQATGNGETLRAGAGEKHVLTIEEHPARQRDGVGDVLDPGDRAGHQGAAVHDARVQFDLAVTVQVRTAPGVKDGVILHDTNRGLGGLDGGSARSQDIPTHSGRLTATGEMLGVQCFGDIPRAAMNDNCRQNSPQQVTWNKPSTLPSALFQ